MREAASVISLACMLAACGVVKDTPADASSPGDAPRDAVSDALVIDAAPDAPPDAPPVSPIPPGARLWLKFDDVPTDGVLDSSATPHTASCTDCPAVVAGKRGMAYQFTSDRINVAIASDLLPGTAFTIAAWVRFDATLPAGNTVIACKQQAGLDCTYALLANAANRIAYHSASGAQANGTTALTLNTWYHVAMTWNGTSRVGYVNGVLDNTTAVGTMGTEASVLSIGARNDASSPLFIPATIDEVVFYNRVLTAAELTQLATP